MKRSLFFSTRTRPTTPSSRVAGALLLVLLAVGGCKNGAPDTAPGGPAAAGTTSAGVTLNAVPEADRYKVTADTAAFFKYSPLQPAGSDLDLKKDTRITMVSKARGYSQIKTPDGQIGYVGTEDIGPLTRAEIDAENAASMQAAQAVAGGAMGVPLTGPGSTVKVTPTGNRRSSGGGYTIPPEAGNDVRLPEPDAKPHASPSPAPGFHY